MAPHLAMSDGARMAFDRRREKSFGEPTRVRTDGTVGSATAQSDGPKKPASTAYERYKQELHAFFNGEKPLPDHLKDMLATRPGAADHGVEAATSAGDEGMIAVESPKAKVEKAEDKRAPRRVVNGPSDEVLAIVEQIRRANSPREVEAAVDALRAKGAALPKEADVLSKALGHGNEDEPGVVEDAREKRVAARLDPRGERARHQAAREVVALGRWPPVLERPAHACG